MYKFNLGDLVKVNSEIISRKSINYYDDLYLEKWSIWLISKSTLDNTSFGKIEKISKDTLKVLVTFDKPVFEDHPLKVDEYGFSAYLPINCLVNLRQYKKELEYYEEYLNQKTK